jgi:DNA repair protein RecN (Recombination protein N)
VLVALAVEDLAVLRRLDLPLGPGLTVITGESGAGKSFVLRAIELAAGGRADASLVREGRPAARLALKLAAGGRAVEVGREIRRDGRALASLDGRPARLVDLRDALEPWLGGGRQGDAYRLRQSGGAVAWLDRLEPVPAVAAATAAAATAVVAARDALARAGGADPRALARRADYLRFAVAEIEAAGIVVGEREALRRERERLSHVERLTQSVAQAAAALRSDRDEVGAVDLLGVAERAVRQAAALDPQLAERADALAALVDGARELARDLGRYLDGLAPDPAREEAVAERLALIDALTRKYGDDEAAILGFADEARAELAAQAADAERLEALREAVAQAEARWREAALALSAARGEAARRLEREAAAELSRLALPEARLFVRVERDETAAVSPLGMDRVEVLFAAHSGAPLLSLGEAASGGETSRILLALEAVLARARPGATWLFDEVEAGVGGSAAWDVARTLRRLARDGQVLLVTHLAPVAAMADTHLTVRKRPGPDAVAESEVAPVEGEARVAELARMLSGEGAAASEHARELLKRARALIAAEGLGADGGSGAAVEGR